MTICMWAFSHFCCLFFYSFFIIHYTPFRFKKRTIKMLSPAIHSYLESLPTETILFSSQGMRWWLLLCRIHETLRKKQTTNQNHIQFWVATIHRPFPREYLYVCVSNSMLRAKNTRYLTISIDMYNVIYLLRINRRPYRNSTDSTENIVMLCELWYFLLFYFCCCCCCNTTKHPTSFYSIFV